MVHSNVAWSDYLYDAFEVLLFALRGNMKNFFTMGIPDEVVMHLSLNASFSSSSFSNPVCSF